MTFDDEAVEELKWVLAMLDPEPRYVERDGNYVIAWFDEQPKQTSAQIKREGWDIVGTGYDMQHGYYWRLTPTF